MKKQTKKYKHIKTGKEYELITDKFMFKDFIGFTCESETHEQHPIFDWKRNLILYRALYENPNGEYFARTAEDFYENFEAI